MSEIDRPVEDSEVVEKNPHLSPPERPQETGLFQSAPSTPEEVEQGKPVPLSPEAVGELTEEQWYAQAYRGGAAQLTPRAIAMGGALGFLLSFTNLYVGLKTGWHLGVTITACILSFSIWGFFMRIGAAKTSMTILENNCMASTASAAGYATGGTLVSAIPALFMLSVSAENPQGVQLPWPVLGAWTFFLAMLGTLLAIPMKRNMINQERLRFPTGTAAATTLKSLYSQGEEAIAKGRALMMAAAFSGVLPLLKDLDIFKINIFKGLAGALGVMDATGKLSRTALIPGQTPVFDWLPTITAGGKAKAWSSWNVVLDHGVALVAAGALVGIRITVS
ncbi:MAG TPA: OPT/YSL family transporter, partial [Polyangium sp.]|nr:OPT/YSL family transporter [Polyangium sp.]